jgi:hypothetical protein
MLAAGVPGARAVRRLQQDLDDFLPAVQLGVTLCSLALGWLGEPLAAASSWAGLALCPAPGPCPGLCPCGCCRRRYAGLCPHHLLSCGGGRTGAQIAGPAPGRGPCRGRGAAHAGLHGPGPAGGAPAQGSAAVILRGFDIPMTERAQVHSPEELKLIATAARRMGVLPAFRRRSFIARWNWTTCHPRDHDPAAEDFLAALEHAVEQPAPGHRAQALARAGLRREPRPRAHCRRGLLQGPGPADVLPAQAPRALRPAPVVELKLSR